MKVALLAFIKFFFIASLFIISNGNLHLKDTDERQVFFDLYTSWLEDVFEQGVEVTGYVVNSRWLPGNNYNPNQIFQPLIFKEIF
ncbi:hypothetical protein K0A97_00565 [Patescibacteria group bacterium]|nr:hypothetical protein [Patescibacteria group bacterium]